MVLASGSAKTVDASEKEMPCFFRFSEALASSHSKVKLITENIRCFAGAGKASNAPLQRRANPLNLGFTFQEKPRSTESAASSLGRLYLYFVCPRVGGTGFAASAARRTSSFVKTAKRNGCDSRK